MAKKALVGILLGGGLLFSTGVLPVSALSIDEVQTHIQQFLAKIQELTAQLNALRALQSSDAQPPGSTLPRHRICEVLNRNLVQGMKGDDVLGLQQYLQEQGYLNTQVTGFYGPLTAQAVARWQTEQGVSPVGLFGPVSRERIRIWCGNPNPYPTPTCRPVSYMPSLCNDSSPPQPTHSENGCIIGYVCPVANFTPPANCKAWSDGCNECWRTSVNASPICTMRACFAAGKGYCSTYFDSVSSNRPPIISGFSGPTTLTINQSGTWSINASDPENQTLSYQVTWGDEYVPYAMNSAMMARAPAFVQTTTFTHSYAAAGTYAITIIVQDASGQSAKTSTTVQVGSGNIYCTQEYAPVCGQPPEPACRHSVPACMMATPGPQTYSNICYLNAAGAALLYSGQCQNTVACTQEAMQCPDGSYVGRTGPNCQFVCPTSTGASCMTPWGSQTVAHNATISSQPYFSNGQYSGSVVVPLMRCNNGSWLRCDYQGNNCQAY